jgi:hypothetical protein
LIDDDLLSSIDKSVGLCSANIDGLDMSNNNYASLFPGTNELKSIRFYAGATDKNILSSAPFKVLSDGSLYASAAKITGDITATSGNFSNVTINDTCTILGGLKGNTISSLMSPMVSEIDYIEDGYPWGSCTAGITFTPKKAESGAGGSDAYYIDTYEISLIGK